MSKIDRSQPRDIFSRRYEGKPLTWQVVAVENARLIFVSGRRFSQANLAKFPRKLESINM